MGGLSCMKSLTATLAYRSRVGNNHQAHPATGEIPSLRFASAVREGNSLFRPFALPRPYTSVKEIFCLRERRTVNDYRRTSLYGHEIDAAKAPVLDDVELHLIPDEARQILDIRIWSDNRLIQSTTLPLAVTWVHL